MGEPRSKNAASTDNHYHMVQQNRSSQRIKQRPRGDQPDEGMIQTRISADTSKREQDRKRRLTAPHHPNKSPTKQGAGGRGVSSLKRENRNHAARSIGTELNRMNEFSGNQTNRRSCLWWRQTLKSRATSDVPPAVADCDAGQRTKDSHTTAGTAEGGRLQAGRRTQTANDPEVEAQIVGRTDEHLADRRVGDRRPLPSSVYKADCFSPNKRLGQQR